VQVPLRRAASRVASASTGAPRRATSQAVRPAGVHQTPCRRTASSVPSGDGWTRRRSSRRLSTASGAGKCRSPVVTATGDRRSKPQRRAAVEWQATRSPPSHRAAARTTVPGSSGSSPSTWTPRHGVRRQPPRRSRDRTSAGVHEPNACSRVRTPPCRPTVRTSPLSTRRPSLSTRRPSRRPDWERGPHRGAVEGDAYWGRRRDHGAGTPIRAPDVVMAP
jgi:hypothetical protein